MMSDGSMISSARSRGAPVLSSIDIATPIPRQRPPSARLRPARREPRPVPQYGRPPQRGRVVAAVLNQAERIAVRHRFRRHQVAKPDLEAVEAVLAAGDVDD